MPHATEPRGQSPTAEISNAVVHVLAEFTGRGPTKARTTIDDNLIVCVVQDTLTRGERNLVGDGKSRLVLDVRTEFQDSMRDALVSAVEGISKRDVIAFMSSNHIDPDVGIEAFVLAPVAS